MKAEIKNLILQATEGSSLTEEGKIQDLWSGYGSIKRYKVEGPERTSIIVKHINLEDGNSHPRGWATNLSHQRKLKSYEVESNWYSNWSSRCSRKCYVPECLLIEQHENEVLIVLEDLDTAGFDQRRSSASMVEIKSCLKWLAHFHATFMGESPEGLWEVGTYWHLATRPDELNSLKDKDLKNAAKAIDAKLNSAGFKTLVHGDAKLANFCFDKTGKKVAAVDFQYVGGGCGIKDVAYFIGSCLHEKECEKYVPELLDYYFQILGSTLKDSRSFVSIEMLVDEWRELFPYAWTDFHRFIKGWSPGHWKINDYSEKLSREVLNQIA